MRFWKAVAFALQVLGIASGLVGLFTAPYAKGFEGIAWAALWLVVFLIPGYMLWPKAADVVVRLRDYQKMVDSAAEASRGLNEAKQKLGELPGLIAEARVAGQLDALGALTATQSEAVLNPVAATLEEDRLTLIALQESGDEPALGSRFLMRSSRLTQTRKGIFVMTGIDDAKRIELVLTQQHEGTEQFWKRAFERAAIHDAPPEQVELVVDPLLQDLIEKVES